MGLFTKSSNVSGKVIVVSLMSAALMIMVIDGIYAYFPNNAERIVSTALPLLGILIWFLMPKKQREKIDEKIKKRAKKEKPKKP